MTILHAMYFDLTIFRTGYESDGKADDVRIGEPRRHIKEFTLLLRASLHEHCKGPLYTLMFHLLDHVRDDVEQPGFPQVLGASPIERFSLDVKREFRTTSQRVASIWLIQVVLWIQERKMVLEGLTACMMRNSLWNVEEEFILSGHG